MFLIVAPLCFIVAFLAIPFGFSLAERMPSGNVMRGIGIMHLGLGAHFLMRALFDSFGTTSREHPHLSQFWNALFLWPFVVIGAWHMLTGTSAWIYALRSAERQSAS